MTITLLQGDCLEILPTLTEKVDAIITDLPYGTTSCSWDTVIPFAPMWAAVKRILKPRGVFVTTASQPFTSLLIVSNLDWFKYCWVWDKNYGANFMSLEFMPLLTHEDICVFSSGGANQGSKNPMTYNPIMEAMKKARQVVLNKWTQNIKNPKSDCLKNRAEIQKTIFEKYPKSVINLTNSDHSNRVHPTQKPVALYSYLIQTYTNPGETVLDICAGSGTTGVAAIQTGRNAILIERDAAYFAIMQKRIADAQQQMRLPMEVE